MKLVLSIATGVMLFAAGAFCAVVQPTNAVASKPVYVPDTSHQNEPLPDGLIIWDALTKATDATNGQDFARFVFNFTNVAQIIKTAQATNVTTLTNFTSVTNSSFWARLSGKTVTRLANFSYATNVVTVTNSITPVPVTILSVHPSCGCTTAELPPVPWTIPSGTNGQIKIAVNLQGKAGMLFKSVNITTDKGRKDLMLRINILPPPPPKPMTAEERAHGVAMAKIDRQAVFKGACASCHVKNIQGKYGQPLFAALCSVCHEANPRASMVPDLHQLKDQTSEEFWRAWITAGKAGTLMPAFATSQGGPLNDLQIASLAAFLNTTIPPHPVPPVKK